MTMPTDADLIELRRQMGTRAPGTKPILVDRIIARLDAAELNNAWLREAHRLLHRYVEDDIVEAGDAFGQWDDDVREYVTTHTGVPS
jgi:hypothetical protein